MATYKRRIVYLSDEEWAWLGEEAEVQRMSVSALVRSILEIPGDVHADPPPLRPDIEAIELKTHPSVPTPKAVIRTFTPVPKPPPKKKPGKRF